MAHNKRTIERVMLAASNVKTADDREAAILGGIVRSLLDTGHMDPNYVRHSTSAMLGWGLDVAREIHRATADHTTPPFSYPSAGLPTLAELKPMMSAFLAQYDPPRAAA